MKKLMAALSVIVLLGSGCSTNTGTGAAVGAGTGCVIATIFCPAGAILGAGIGATAGFFADIAEELKGVHTEPEKKVVIERKIDTRIRELETAKSRIAGLKKTRENLAEIKKLEDEIKILRDLQAQLPTAKIE